jgi:hypothetical protein
MAARHRRHAIPLGAFVVTGAAQAATPSQRRSHIWVTPVIIAASLAAGALYAALAGDDVNWDWQNYHEYNVWGLINGRYGTDVAPSGFQTYFNPLVYLPVYGLRHFVSPFAAGVVMGAVHGLNLALIFMLTRIMLGSAANVAGIAASVLIAACGAMTLSEVGTSFADILTSLPVITGLILILRTDQPRPANYVLAGALIGAAVGLKLTNVVFALGLVAMVIAATRPLVAIGCVTVGGAIGSLLTGGTWSLMLWREFGNPVFPLFNGFFASPDAPPASVLDLQFIPRSLLDALAYPFYWLVGDNRSSEHPFRDARFAVLLVLLPVAIGLRLSLRSCAGLFTRRDIQLLVFFIVSYAAWLDLFSIHRYAIVLELLCGPLIVLLLARILLAVFGAGTASRHSGFRTGAAPLAVALAIAIWTQPGDWWRRPWTEPYRPIISERLQQPAVYLLLDKPIAYVAPLLAPQSRFYQLSDIALPILPNRKFDRRIRAGLKAPLPGGIWELHIRGTLVQTQLLERYGLAQDASQACVQIESVTPRSRIEACPVAARD